MKKYNLKKMDTAELAGLVSEELRKEGIDSVLVGGACVTIYSDNEYMSLDLDFVSHSRVKKIKPVLEKIGFIQKKSGQFENKNCEYFIDFVSPPVSVGKKKAISKFNELKKRTGTFKLLTPTDCVKDRLAAYYHWNDPQSLEQAIMVAKNNKVDSGDIKTWSNKENALDKYENFIKKLKTTR